MFTCLICETPFEEDKYDKNVCPNCGQVYVYDEAQMIDLTKEQLAALRRLKGLEESK